MKFKRIGMKMLACLLPVIIVTLIAMTIISAYNSDKIINEQTKEYMEAQLDAQSEAIETNLTTVRTAANTAASMAASSYQYSSIEQLLGMLRNVTNSDDKILGCGIWFEPYTFDNSMEYVGPYIYKSEDGLTTTYEYSNAAYDYFNQDYYLMAKNSKQVIITDPYYDATTGYIMASCSAPILDTNGNFIGCITVDVNLDSIKEMVSAIQVGDAGSAMLITSKGIFMGGVSEKILAVETNIADSKNKSLAAAGKIINADTNEHGFTTYTANGEIYDVYYQPMDTTGWKLLLQIPESELQAPVKQLFNILLAVGVLALIACTVVVLLLVRSIAGSLKQVQKFAGSLAKGDFTTDKLEVTSGDELGMVGDSLNDMYHSNKEILQNISKHAVNIEGQSQQLNTSAHELFTQFQQIQQFVSNVNDEMNSSSAATQEVNASTEEVNSNVSVLADKTKDSMEMAKEIRGRANDVGTTSQKAYDFATNLTGQFQSKLQVAIANAQVVESIGEMANVISNIAEQINLLALNASIEAARAGEQGRGFAVVAAEIGKLANETSQAVNHIQDTITNVKQAFVELTSDAQSMLEFVENTVTPDYDNFVHVAQQYENDAVSIEELSDTISEMAHNISLIMDEVGQAVGSITESIQNTAETSGNILMAVADVSNEVDQVSSMSVAQQEIAEELNVVVEQFKL